MGIRLEDAHCIAASLQAVVQELRDGHPARQILSDIKIDRTVRCDVARVQQVASNLIGNALIQGAMESAAKVTAHVDERDLLFEVWNAGEPIPPQGLEKVYKPFWRHSTPGSRQGLGLGLHICSQIVQAHGGSLAVTSTEEGGTRFTARFPMQGHR